jgi:hypothetical protein
MFEILFRHANGGMSRERNLTDLADVFHRTHDLMTLEDVEWVMVLDGDGPRPPLLWVRGYGVVFPDYTSKHEFTVPSTFMAH